MSTGVIDTTETTTSRKTSWVPTRKWIAGVITALAALFVNWINTGEFTKEIAIQLVGVLATAIVAYLIPNDQRNAAS